METTPTPTGASSTLVLNPDELGPDPVAGMDLAVGLGITALEIRTAWGFNALMLDDAQLVRLRGLAEDRGLSLVALASPLWKWCDPAATPLRAVDRYGFPARVAPAQRERWVQRALAVARLLGAPRVRLFSHLQVGDFTEDFAGDPLLGTAVEAAGAAGVRLLLENEPVCTVAESKPLLDVLERYPELGLWLDVANLHQVGQATPEVVSALAPHVGYVHVKDYRALPGGVREFCPAGTGEVPYGMVLPLLHAARPGLPYALETHVRATPADALRAGAAFLRRAVPGGVA